MPKSQLDEIKHLKVEFRNEFENGQLFTTWKDIYSGTGYLTDWATHRREVVLDCLSRHCSPSSGMSLDIGIGSGFIINFMSSQGRKAFGADVSIEMLRWFRASEMSLGNSRLLMADVDRLPFKGESYCVVTCIGVFEYINSSLNGLGEVYRVLQPGGLLVLAVASYHRVGNLSQLILRRIGMRKSGHGVGGNSLEMKVKMLNPITLKKEAERIGFEVSEFQCFGAKIFGRYFPLKFLIPKIIYIGDHCVMVLKKPLLPDAT